MAEPQGRVEGQYNNHRVTLYALSTCIWCRKTRELLEAEGVTFDYIYVDLIDVNGREAARTHIRQFSDRTSFPAIIVDDQDCIVGFKPDVIKERLGL
jgi:glutaredoxin-like protein NrdH